MKETVINNDQMEILESDEFNSLLEAAELVTRAQSNISQLTKSVEELKELVNADIPDELSPRDHILMFDIIDKMEELVDDLMLGSFDERID